MTDIVFKDESYKIIGACMAVHSQLGPGFLEAVYQEALTKEFMKQQIPFQSQSHLSIYYDDQPLKKYYIADFVCYDEIVVEIKSSEYFHKNQFHQTGNYLRALNKKLGLLVCFGGESLKYHRILNSSYKDSHH